MKTQYYIRHFGLLLSMTFFFTLSFNLKAQERFKQEELFGEKARELVPEAAIVLTSKTSKFPSHIKFRSDKKIKSDEFEKWLRDRFEFDGNFDFVRIFEQEEENGIRTQKFNICYKGIHLEHGLIITYGRGGLIHRFNGYADYPGQINPAPSISESSALAIAMDYVGAEKYLWEIPEEEAFYKEHMQDSTATYYPKGELIVAKDYSDGFHLMWKFDIYEITHEKSQTVFVEAHTGKIMKTSTLVHNCDSGTVATTWHGNKNFQTDNVGSWGAPDYILKDDCGFSNFNTHIHTIMQAGNAEIHDADNNWVEGNITDFATTHYYARKVVDYYETIHNRDGYNDSNSNITFKHVAAPNPGWDNAAAIGNAGEFLIGMNTGAQGEFINTLDVIAHEFTHKVVKHNGNGGLTYEKESGALNESFADILGQMCERWVENNQSIDWTIGENLAPIQPEFPSGGPIRSFIDPKAHGQPDTYGGVNWVNQEGCVPTGGSGGNDNCGVHTNSGVMNHWFYILTVGKTGTNDLGNDYKVTGIGLTKMRTLVYKNLLGLLPNATYKQARSNSIAIAEDEWGECSDEVKQVINAWYAVGVGKPTVKDTVDAGVCSGDFFAKELKNYIFWNTCDNISFEWTAVYPDGITGGMGDVESGLVITETLTNNTSETKTVAYFIRPKYNNDEFGGPIFELRVPILPAPIGNDSEKDIACSGDEFSISLPDKIINNIESSFAWAAEYNGLTGGAGAGIGNVLNETLANNTGTNASAIYTIIPKNNSNGCEGPPFTITVKVLSENTFDGHNYLLTPEKMMWQEAEDYAASLGGYLVAINSQEEQDFLVEAFGSDELFWIGFTDEATEDFWTWTSGEPKVYENWYPEDNEPNNVNGGEDYAVMNWIKSYHSHLNSESGYWNDLGAGSPEWVPYYGIVELPEPCKCSFTTDGLSNIQCNDNGTPNNLSDDFITFELNPNGNNQGDSYTVSGINLTPSGGNYGTSMSYQTDPGYAGTGDVSLTITDDNDESCTIEFTLTDPGVCSDPPLDVCSYIESAKDIVYSLNMPGGLAKSLISKLNNALSSFENGNMNAAKGKLNAFINQVYAQTGLNIPIEATNGLVNLVQAILALIKEGSKDCSNSKRLAGNSSEHGNLDFVIYPNPATANENVVISILGEIDLADLVIFDQHGRLVFNEKIEGGQSKHLVLLDDRFLGGIYHVSLMSNGARSIKKLVVVKD